MLTILGSDVRHCDGLSRRSFLKIGGLAMGGLSLPQLLQAETAAGTICSAVWARGAAVWTICSAAGAADVAAWAGCPPAWLWVVPVGSSPLVVVSAVTSSDV